LIEIRIRLSESGDDAIAATLRRTEMDKQNLILVMMNNQVQRSPAPSQIPLRKLALENRILQMIAEATHGLENFAKPAIVRNVVTHQIGLAHI